MDKPILEIKNAGKTFGGGFISKTRVLTALDSFNLTINEGDAGIYTIAGESGSGKTTLANCILGFLNVSSGEILYRGKNIANLNREEKLTYRREVQAVFQDPYAVYNPFYRVMHVFDVILKNFNLGVSKQDGRDLVEQALQTVGLQGKEILEKYPHQLSGGQRQRIMIARAYMLSPKIIVADEPVSAVDASLRAMILDIIQRMKEEKDISFIYITHDLSTAYQVGDRIFILFQGEVVEEGETERIIKEPQHPYVQELIASIPVPDPDVPWDLDIGIPDEEEMRFSGIQGCPYSPRCPHKKEICGKVTPKAVEVAGRAVRCHLYY